MNPHENTNSNFYEKLVDLYAGRELDEQLEDDMSVHAAGNPELAVDMKTLRQTVDLIHEEEAPEFTEESYQRILLKMYTRGVQIQKQTPDPYHLQYQLPIQG